MADARISLGVDDQTAAGFNTIDKKAEAAAKKAQKEFKEVTEEIKKVGPIGGAAFAGVGKSAGLALGVIAVGISAAKEALAAVGEAITASMRDTAQAASDSIAQMQRAQKMISDGRKAARGAGDSALGTYGDPMRAVVALAGDRGVERARALSVATGGDLKDILGLVADAAQSGILDPQADAAIQGSYRLADLGLGKPGDLARGTFKLGRDTLRELLGDEPLEVDEAARRLRLGDRFAASRSPEAEQERQDMLRARQDDWWARRQQIKDKLDRTMMDATVAERHAELTRWMRPEDLEALRADTAPTLDELDADGMTSWDLTVRRQRVDRSQYLGQVDSRRQSQAALADLRLEGGLRDGATASRLELGTALAEFDHPGITAAVEAMRQANQETAQREAEAAAWEGAWTNYLPAFLGGTAKDAQQARRAFRQSAEREGRLGDAVREITDSERVIPVRVVGGGSAQIGE